MSQKWKKFYTKEEMQNISVDINNSQSLCNKYYVIYDIVFPEKRNSTINRMFFNFCNEVLFSTKKTYPSPYVDIYRVLDLQQKIEKIDFKSGVRKPGLIFGFGISKYTTPQKCFDYMHDITEVDELAIKLFDKKCGELDNYQMLEVVLKIEYPHFRNNQDAFKRKYNIYMKELTFL